MRRLFFLAAALTLTACTDDSVSEPCVFRVNVFEAQPASVQVGVTVPIDLELTVRSGNCQVPQNTAVSWATSNINVIEFLTQTNSTAQVRGKKAGSAFILAWLTLSPSVRDSITLTVTDPVDN